MSASANCDLDGMYKLYGEAVPILDMPMRQQGGAECKPCTQDLMLDDAENPRPDGGKFDSMFGGYLAKVAEKFKDVGARPAPAPASPRRRRPRP